MKTSKQSSIVSKCNTILDLVAESNVPLSFTDIVERSGFVKSSTHRVLNVLLTEDLIGLDSRSKTYRLGPKIMKWAMRAWHGHDVQRAAAAELDELAEITGQNVGLAIMDDEGGLYLRVVNNFQLRYVSKSGDRPPLHCTAVGKVLTAYQPDHRRHQLFNELKLERFTERTITDRKAFIREITEVAHRGYAVNDGEEFLQICGIASPVFQFGKNLAGAICVWSLNERANLAQLKQMLPDLNAATRRISESLGYQEH